MSTPKGFSTLTPVVITQNAQATIESYQKALGAVVNEILHCPVTGKVAHACINIGDSTIFASNEFPELDMLATGKQEFYLYLESADSAYEKATKAGWLSVSEPEDTFWGDRVGAVQDTDGNIWKLAQRVREVSPEEIDAAMKAMGEAA